MQPDTKERQIKIIQRAAMYLELFSTPAGKKVLEDLESAFHHAPLQSIMSSGSDGRLDPYKTIYNAGAREVLEHIKGLIWIATYPDKYMSREISSPEMTMDDMLDKLRKERLGDI